MHVVTYLRSKNLGRQTLTRTFGGGLLAAVLVLLALTAGDALAKRAPDEPLPSSIAALPQWEQGSIELGRIGNTWIDTRTGLVQTAMGLSAGPYAGDPENVARQYLREASATYGLADDLFDLRLADVQGTPGGFHIRFNQMKAGVDVWRADIVVSLDRSGEYVTAVSNNYDADLAKQNWLPVASVLEADAYAIAAGAIGLPHDRNDSSILREALTADPRAELLVVREGDVAGGSAHLVQRVFLASEAVAGDWQIRVDAENASILGVEDTRVYVDGSGLAFDPDPLTTAEVSYGGNYGDNNDGDTAELNAERFTRPLPDLTYSGGVYQLAGPWVRITNFEAPNDPAVTSTDPDGFNYTRSQQGFEDVHVYFHIDESQRWIQALGFNNIQHGQINVDTHGLNGQDNSYYSPGYNRIALGEGGVDDAEDTDVVTHEYGHAIQHSIVPNWGGGHQGAMGEGFGDYWTGSYSGSISSFRDYWVFNWDGHNPFWGGRVLNTWMHYPENLNGSVHSDGQIWSAPLWESWHEVGRDVMDLIVLQHHFYQGGYATMATAAGYVMQADANLYDGLHAATLDHYFTERGMFTAAQYTQPEITHTPLDDQSAGGPYQVVCLITSDLPLTAGTLKVVYGVDGTFDHEADLVPTGNPDEYAGLMDHLGDDLVITYYLKAQNNDGWYGTSPRGAEFTHYSFTVENLSGIEDQRLANQISLRISPNPVVQSSVIQLNLPTEQEIDLAVFDASGRRIRTLAEGHKNAGPLSIQWDGRTEAGEPASAGVYWVRMRLADRALVRQMVVSR